MQYRNRFALIVVLICSLVLAACGGKDNDETPAIGDNGSQAAPNSTGTGGDTSASGGTPAPGATDTSGGGVGQAEATAAVVVGAPGELVAESTVESSNSGQTFDVIYFMQQGGPESITINIELGGDGHVIVNGTPQANATPDQISALTQKIDEIDFFAVQGTFSSTVPQPQENYTYSITVVRGELGRTIRAQDGFIPPEFSELLGMVRAAAGL